MINYGYILKQKEKDNPCPMCRGSYLFSNVGDLVKCYGRKLRFPQDAKLYEAEMKLAIGDIIMQCQLIEQEHNLERRTWDEYRNSPDDQIWTDIEMIIGDQLPFHATYILEQLTDAQVNDCLDEVELGERINWIMWCCYELCKLHEWVPEDVAHLGFLHVCERFEQFEREEWK